MLACTLLKYTYTSNGTATRLYAISNGSLKLLLLLLNLHYCTENIIAYYRSETFISLIIHFIFALTLLLCYGAFLL